MLASHEWQLAAMGERLDERLGPEVLVHIGLHELISRFSINFIENSR